jgi:heterodisulfide reductase subunit A
VATGAQEYRPAEYLYGENPRVVTNLELDEKIDRGDNEIINAKGMVMIQCVGSRSGERNYCSRVCCSHSIKNALRMKEINPQIDITILFRDMRTYGFMEDYYREAAAKGVKFIRYETNNKPKVKHNIDNDTLRVEVYDPVLCTELAIDADILVLAAAVIPSSGTKEISKLFKLPLTPDGFYQEAHVKLRPVDFAAEGVFICGTAHYPKHIKESINQALGASGRAATILSRDSVTVSGAVCEVNEELCVSCGACIKVCAYGAIAFTDTPKGKKANVNPVLCKGDGLCNAKCPTGAISLKQFTDEEIFAQIDAAI